MVVLKTTRWLFPDGLKNAMETVWRKTTAMVFYCVNENMMMMMMKLMMIMMMMLLLLKQ